jgi:hypothetical protein
MQDPDFQFLSSILANCEGRKECDASDPTGHRCENYYLCYPSEATLETKKLQKDKIKRFKKAMRKLEKASMFFDGLLDELQKVL